MDGIRKIITNAVYGRKSQTFRKIIRVTARDGENHPDVLGARVCGATVLGCSIEGDTEKSKNVIAKVRFDIHIWCRTDNDSELAKISAEFSDHIEVAKQADEAFVKEKVNVWMKEQPKCFEPVVIGHSEKDRIAVEMEYVLETEITGEAMLRVRVFDT